MTYPTNPPWLASIHHDGSPCYVTRHHTGMTAMLRLRASLAAPISHVSVRTCPDGEQHLTSMRRVADAPACQWWEAEIPRAMPRDGYRFFLITEAGGWWLSAAGTTRHTPTDATDFKLLSEANELAWVRDSIFYQIFPDRFADGDPSNNVQSGEYLYRGRPVIARNWGELPRRETGAIEFFGGDLQGIIQKLPYLEDLGVTALYLNPIFTAPSSHKYDTASYDEVDPHLGGNHALVDLRRALDERGMRLVLDVVPNHCGATHPWFCQAQADRSAPTASFFSFRRHPDEYESWLGVASLPKFNYRGQALREAMYAGENSVMRRWMRPPYRIDGWRLDVANMLARQGESQLGHKIGRGLRRAIKAESPEAYILGEHFYDGTPHLQGDELDASMNYRGFTIPLVQWLAGEYLSVNNPTGDLHTLPTEALAAQWRAFLSALPWQIALQQFNMLGSHDTPRIITVLGGDLAKAKLAMTLLFTYPGVPCIYYGDEIGLAGGGDPDCRRSMPWRTDQWNQELLAHVKALTRLRRSSRALRIGGFQVLHAAGETLAFLRDAPEERMIVVARRDADYQPDIPVHHGGIPDKLRFREVFSGVEVAIKGGRLSPVGPYQAGAQVWVARG